MERSSGGKKFSEFLFLISGLGPSSAPGFKDTSVRTSTKLVYPLGRLKEKHEAAGKLRIFAMVDSLTQAALGPLHRCLFDFLRQLPNDATFDQRASVKRCQEKSIR